METAFDILILGGGLVGCSLACALEGRGYRVGLVEASAESSGSPGFDERKLALSAVSLQALQALDVLPRLNTLPTPIRRLHISRAGDFGAVRLAASDYGREQFGAVVLARELGEALEQRVRQCRGLQRFRPATVTAVSPSTGADIGVSLRAADSEQTLTTRLLVAADGTRSLAREALGIGVDRHDYRQTLFVCTLTTDRSPDGTAFERFTEQGPVALLPMSAGQYGSICAVASEETDSVAALDDHAYAEYFQQRFGWRAGRVRRVGTRSCYPLVRTVARRLDAQRALLMGNAAQTIHPIGAQGFNLGLRDALSLAERLDGGDPGDAKVLADYVAAREQDRTQTLAFSDGLARFTATPGLTAQLLRSLGLSMLSSMPRLAAPLVSGAMGYRGQVPKLARVPR